MDPDAPEPPAHTALTTDSINAVLTGKAELSEDAYGNPFVTRRPTISPFKTHAFATEEKERLRMSLKAYVPMPEDAPAMTATKKPTWVDRFKGRANQRTEYLRMTTLFLAVAIFWITVGITDIVQDVNSGTGWWGAGVFSCFIGVVFGFTAGLWASMIDDERSY
jgi:hypothetical protein